MKLRNSEFISFVENLILIANREMPTISISKSKLGLLTEELEKIKTVFRETSKQKLPEELKQADRLRKNAIIGIRKIAEANTYHSNKNMQAAAKLVLSVIKTFSKDITLQNKLTRTATINVVVNALKRSPNRRNALTMLQLNNWLEELHKENQAFDQLFIKNIDNKSEKSKEKIKELRQVASNYYYILRDYINACYTLDSETYKPVLAQLNQLIKEYNTIVNRRKGKSKRKRKNVKFN